MRKILFISDYAPTESNSGGLVMLEQLDFLRNYFTADILVYNSASETYSASLQKSARIYVRSKFGELQPNIQNRFIKRFLEVLFNTLIIKPWLLNEKKKLQSIIDNQNHETVFITIQGLYLAKLLNLVHFKDKSVVIQYWDPDSWWALNHNFSKQSVLEIYNQHKILNESKAARKILVPSEGMAESLISRSSSLNQKIEVFYPAIKAVADTCDAPSSYTQIRNRHKRLLLFTGNVYTLPELLLLVDTIISLNESDPDLDLAFVVIGPTSGDPAHTAFTEIASVKSKIYLIERLSPSEIDTCLSLADINFLPYPFTNRQLVKESFPSKFSKYLGAKRPILFLTPDYSSLSRMIRESGISIGLVVVPSKTNLKYSILQILKSSEVQKLQLSQLLDLEKKYFSKDKQQNLLAEVFQIDKNEDQNKQDLELVKTEVYVSRDWTQAVNFSIRFFSVLFGPKLQGNVLHRFLIFLKGFMKVLAYNILEFILGKDNLKSLIRFLRRTG